MSQAASTTQSATAAPVGSRRPMANEVGGVGVIGTTMSARFGETEWEAREVGLPIQNSQMLIRFLLP